jgi:hypothetical protein
VVETALTLTLAERFREPHSLFDQDFSASVKEHRADLLAAVLTIWRWGRQTPLKPGMPLGSFERWASWCRDPLLALGCVDPAQRAAEIKSEDPLRQRIFEFLQAWHDRHGSRPIKLRDLDARVAGILGGSRQRLATFVGNLANARAAGFLIKVRRPASNWGVAEYAVHRDDEIPAH